MKKILLFLGLMLGISGLFLFSTLKPVQADSTTATYDLKNNTPQTFQVGDEQGQSISITVSPASIGITDPTSSSLLASRNYTIKKRVMVGQFPIGSGLLIIELMKPMI